LQLGADVFCRSIPCERQQVSLVEGNFSKSSTEAKPDSAGKTPARGYAWSIPQIARA
jgi:hypothetical protein